MTSTLQNKRYTIGVLVFPRLDILDFTGPIEVFSLVSANRDVDNPDRIYTISTIGSAKTIRAANSLSIDVDILIEDALRDLDKFDTLVVPGGPPSAIMPLLTPESPEMRLITSFAQLGPKTADGEPRTLFSVCTGAFFLGAARLLGGLRATTHMMALDGLRQICAGVGSEPSEIVVRRYIDCGVGGAAPVSIVMAGGVSSALDGALYIVSKQTSREVAEFIATKAMEYEWREAK